MNSNILTPHINAKQNDFAKTILMPGDPLRSQYIAEKYLKRVKLVNNIRGVQGYTGYYKGKKVSVMAHGMGMSSISIYAYELFNFYNVDNIIRIGTCGAMKKEINVRDIILADFAYTTSNIGKRLGNKKPISYCSNKLLETAKQVSVKTKNAVHIGGVFTSDVFYGQNNQIKYAKKGCLGVEMEVYALYSIAKQANKNALGILTVSDSMITGEKTTAEERQSSFDEMIVYALETAIKS